MIVLEYVPEIYTTEEELKKSNVKIINFIEGSNYSSLEEYRENLLPAPSSRDRPSNDFTPTKKALPAPKTTMGRITKACNTIRHNLHEGTVNHAKWFGQSALDGTLTIGTILSWFFNCCSTPLGCIKFWSIVLSGGFIGIMALLGILNWLCTL